MAFFVCAKNLFIAALIVAHLCDDCPWSLMCGSPSMWGLSCGAVVVAVHLWHCRAEREAGVIHLGGGLRPPATKKWLLWLLTRIKFINLTGWIFRWGKLAERCIHKGLFTQVSDFGYKPTTLGVKDFRGFRWVRGFEDKTIWCIPTHRIVRWRLGTRILHSRNENLR